MGSTGHLVVAGSCEQSILCSSVRGYVSQICVAESNQSRKRSATSEIRITNAVRIALSRDRADGRPIMGRLRDLGED